jgi:hypothetical protein
MPAIWEIINPGKKQNGNGKVAVLIPAAGEVSIEWMAMMRSLEAPNSSLITTKGYPLDLARDLQVNQALEQGFEWLFFLDSDVIPPKNVIPVFLSTGIPIISGMYTAKRVYPTPLCWSMWGLSPTPCPEKGEFFAPVEKWEGRNICVDVVGCGCLLVHRSVFESIREKYPNYPFFFWTKDRFPGILDIMNLPDEKYRYVSEDFWFCLLAKECGFKIIVDTECKCDHLGDVTFVDLEARISGG